MFHLSFFYPFSIRFLSFCDPILFLSFLGFQLRLTTLINICAGRLDSIKQPRTVKTSLTTDAGFPIKDARFLKLKNISGLLSDGKEGKIKENMD